MKSRAILAVLCAVLLTSVLCELTKAVLTVFPFPALAQFQSRPYSVRILDCDGRVVQILPLEQGLRREFASAEEIPGHVKRCFIRAEDKRFYVHGGIDFVSIARAALQNCLQKRTVSGASTITMQLARIIVPCRKRNVAAKLSELFIAVRLEAKLTKRQILELWLNNIPFGKNTEGIASASWMYFSKDVSSLSPEESLCLSVIPRSPALYNPLDFPERAFLAAKRAAYADIDLNRLRQAVFSARTGSVPFEMPHYIRFLRSEFSGLFSGVHEIRLPCSLRLQLFAQSAVRDALKKAQNSRIDNAAVLVLDVQSGAVLCWVGSNDWNDFFHSGQIDGVLNKMQPGSSMKPFLYAAALEGKNRGQPLVSMNSVLADVPKEFGGRAVYIPRNFNNAYNGPVLLRTALASSLNVPAVALLDQYGTESYAQKLRQLGFSLTDADAEYNGLSLALGGCEVSLYELVPAFASFVRDGIYIPVCHSGCAKAHGAERRVFEKDTARLICSALSDKAARSIGFGYSQTFQTEYPSIFKTGTASQYQSIVALGASKKYAAGVWMGNFSGNTVVGKTGSSLPAAVARQILDFLEFQNDSQEPFPEPQQFHLQEICALSGMKPGAACPHQIFEYVQDGISLAECQWHKRIGERTETVYPAEYQQWVSLYHADSQVDYHSARLQIASPKDGSVFYADADKAAGKQIVLLEVIGGADDELSVLYDGSLFETISRPFSLAVPAEKGAHTVTAVCGTEQAEVHFFVE